MEFNKELFLETINDMCVPLRPFLFLMLTVNFVLLIVGVFDKLFEAPASRIYPNIEDNEEYIDEEEYEDFYDFDNSVLVSENNPIKSK